jgi:hypothetical protein
MLTSCGLKDLLEEKDKDKEASLDLGGNSSDDEDEGPGDGDEEEDEEDKDKDENDDKDKNETSGQHAIYCNDTVTVTDKTSGFETKYTLVLFATNEDGLEGTYHGNISLNYGLDASQISGLTDAPIQGLGGFSVSLQAQDVEFDVVNLDLDKYANYGTDATGDAKVVPLINGTSMALITANMSGSGQLGIEITGKTDANGGTITATQPNVSADGSGPLVIKMYMKDGLVTIQIPSLQKAMDYQSFDAILTSSSDIISQAEEQANEAFNGEE